MNRLCGMITGWTVAAAVAVIVSSGCQRGTRAINTARPTAEESFKIILETFRQGIETGAGGVMPGLVTLEDGGGYTAVSLNNKVSHELFPPGKEGEPFRARITVATRSRLSMVRSGTGKNNRDEDASTRDDSGGDALTTDPDSEILDPELVGSSGSARGSRRGLRGSSDIPISRPPEEATNNYELEYRNGRWELVSEIDPQNKPVKNAFEFALKTQY
jgi:hypothetical protein